MDAARIFEIQGELMVTRYIYNVLQGSEPCGLIIFNANHKI